MTSIVEPRLNSFCWAELAANNASVVKPFYTGLLGWTYVEEEMPEGMGSYITIMVNDMPAGAMFSMPAEMKNMNIPAHWGSYIRVADLDGTVKKAQELGATIIKSPMDVFDAGRMAVVKDPCGAVVSLWQKTNHAGAPVQEHEVGTCCWNELLVHDPKRAVEFYGQLLGWKNSPSEFDGKVYYSMTTSDNVPVGGIMQITDDMGACPPHWGVYFTVADINKAIDYVKKNNGTVFFGPHDVHGMGQFAVCQDPDGAWFSVFQYTK